MAIKDFVSRHTLACLAGGFAIGVVISGVGAAMMSFSGSPAFCGTCHSMKEVTATFAQSTHSKLECVDCHLPHDSMVMYLFEKGRTGMNDVYHEVLRRTFGRRTSEGVHRARPRPRTEGPDPG